ncbi:MAG: hypothetical protein ACR2NA_00075, partial [Solirubrobacterales bacterium]
MRSALAYRPGRSTLHRARVGAAAAWLGLLAVTGLVLADPLLLVVVTAAVAVAGIAAGARRAVAAALRMGVPLAVLFALLNGVVSQRGETILVRVGTVPVLGRVDVSAEALAAGAATGLRILVVLAAFAVWGACVDPDRVLRALRPLARRSVLTASLVSRLGP